MDELKYIAHYIPVKDIHIHNVKNLMIYGNI